MEISTNSERSRRSQCRQLDPLRLVLPLLLGLLPVVCVATPAGVNKIEFPIEVRVRNPEPAAEPRALVQGGFPFSEGMVHGPDSLQLVDATGARIPFQARPLGFWPDGTVKWAELTFILTDFQGGENRVLQLRASGPGSGKDEAAAAENPPTEVVFELTVPGSAHGFVVDMKEELYRGPLCVETRYSGSFADMREQTAAEMWITDFPSIRATRYRVSAKQLTNGGVWQGLRFSAPYSHLCIHREKELGARIAEGGNGRSVAVLFSGKAEPVDCGVGRTWEIWGFEDAGLFAGRPVRPRFSPEYLYETHAMGRFVVSSAPEWPRVFEESVHQVYALRDAEPRNFGWRSFGDFFDRRPNTGLAYMGYVSQEYDPATALLLGGFARTGDMAYSDKAEDLANGFRDMCVSPEGGIYQHRATIHAGEAYVIDIISEGLLRKLQEQASYKPTPEGVAASLHALYGEGLGDIRSGVVEIFGHAPGQRFEDKLAYVAKIFCGNLLDMAVDRVKEQYANVTPEEEAKLQKTFTVRWMFEIYAKDELIRQLGFDDVDKDLQPFFARYGGSWDDFPAFHVDIHPDSDKRHQGGHSLVEMLVRVYFLTGNECLRSTALAVARHQIDFVCPLAIRQNQISLKSQKYIHTRQLSWPLIGLVSLWELTEHRDPELHDRVKDMARQLAYQIAANPIDIHEGGIHAGVGMESLARYHEMTRDPRIEEYLVKWARYWAQTQWDPGRGFRYRRDKEGTGDAALTGLILYGLVYAHDCAPDPGLKERVLAAYHLIEGTGSGSYAKSCAMMYRSTPRALDYILPWLDEGKTTGKTGTINGK